MASFRSSRSDRGFSLAELAIVLGVIGLILGAIFVTISAASDFPKRETVLEAIKAVVADARALYVPNGGVPQLGLAAMTSTFIADGTIPQKLKRPPTSTCSNPSGLCADTPWGSMDNHAVAANGTFQVCQWPFEAAPSPTDCPAGTGTAVTQSFAIALRGLPRSACTSIIAQVTAAGGPTGLLEVVINGTAIGPTGLVHAIQPVLPADTATYCNGNDGTNRVDFVYGINNSSR